VRSTTRSEDFLSDSPTFYKLVEVKVGRNLFEDKLSGHYHRFVRFITRLDDPVRSAHAN
jgi:hypothetical protein